MARWRGPNRHAFAARSSRLPRLSETSYDERLLPILWNTVMPAVKQRACTILGEFARAQTELVGKAVVLTDGKAGTVESVCLDEIHGLRISIRGHKGVGPSRPSNSLKQP